MEPDQVIIEKLEKIEERLSIIEEKIKNTPTDSSLSPINSPQKLISAKEFLIAKKPKDDVQTTFLLGGYIEIYEKQPSFNIEDLKKLFSSAKVPTPSNLNDKVNKNISKGLFMEGEARNNKKAWTLTLTGEEKINHFKNE